MITEPDHKRIQADFERLMAKHDMLWAIEYADLQRQWPLGSRIAYKIAAIQAIAARRDSKISQLYARRAFHTGRRTPGAAQRVTINTDDASLDLSPEEIHDAIAEADNKLRLLPDPDKKKEARRRRILAGLERPTPPTDRDLALRFARAMHIANRRFVRAGVSLKRFGRKARED